MFTGIIDHFGSLEALEETPQSKRLRFASRFDSFDTGESVAVNGVCLTVTQFQGGAFTVDVSSETLKLTNLSQLKVKDAVNFEKALRLGDRFGGHVVTGHVDCTAKVSSLATVGEYLAIRFSDLPKQFCKYLVKKGSIAVNGVSLTLNEVNKTEGSFEVMLIPHTLEKTNLSQLTAGSLVNIEMDTTVKTILERVEELLPELVEKR